MVRLHEPILLTSPAGISGDELIAHSVATFRKGAARLALPTRRISLGLVGDSEYAKLENPQLHAMTDANQVDGIFTAQMDIHFRVEQLEMFDESSDPFLGSSDVDVLLGRLVDFKQTSPTYAPLGLIHALTWRFLDDNSGTENVTATATSIPFDYDPDNDSVSASHVLSGNAPTPAEPGGSSGGGGAPLWLLILVAGQLAFRRPVGS